ncbi:MAG TPA: tetratricopeptide repeat protein [Xanthomonadaceae bacterium]|nr:tetratricopeptide repeat protein [Xanthomonadaceae bacterium]
MDNRSLKVMLISVLIGAFLAQDALGQRHRRDQAARERERQSQPETSTDREALYPNATRQEPEGQQASRKLAKKLQALIDDSNEERFDEVISGAREIIASADANAYDKAIAYQSLAFAHLEQDDYVQAAQAIEQALATNALSNDTHFQLMRQLAQIQLAEEQYDRAIVTVDRFLTETRAEDGELLAMKGNALYRLERCGDAIPVLEEASAKLERNQSAVTQILMACYFETEQPLKAAGMAEQALAKDPDNKSLIRNLSSIYLQAEQEQKAAQVLEDAKNRGLLSEAEDYKQLYQLYRYVENDAKAIEVIREGQAKDILPKDAETYRALGEAAYFSENIPVAIEAFQKGAAVAGDGELALSLARVLHEEQRYPEAKAAAQEALAKGVKQKGHAYLVIGGAELGLNNKEAAIAAYRQATQYPESKSVAESWLKSAGRM